MSKLAVTLVAPTLSACGTMGFPHIGTVDTRHHAPGTVNAQATAGAGIGVFPYPVSGAVGLGVAGDRYFTSRFSVVGSGHFLAAFPAVDEFTGSARLGLRLRPTQKLSLGLGAYGALSTSALLGGDSSANQAAHAGGDFEIATSSVKPDDRFVSHAWRLSVGRSNRSDVTGMLLGDWSRSRPTRNKNLRLSYGVNYGMYMSMSRTEGQNGQRGPGRPLEVDAVGFFFGGHVGVQWGRKGKG